MSGEQGLSVGGSVRAAVPQELSDFFSIGGRSLLIKGSAGTGKTTLALTLLPVLSATRNFLYLSTRESPDLFSRDHPWLEEAVENKKDPAPKEGETRISTGFVDARLDEATQVFERITSQLMDANAPVIVIDTLDALEDFIDAKSMKTNVRVLQTWCERAGARLVVTMEDPDSDTLDPLMDGVVTLRQRVADNRRLRQIELLKLYGVRIARPSYFFTLNGGWFRSFSVDGQDSYAISPTAVYGGVPRRLRTRAGFFTTGYGEFDGILGGGLQEGGLTALDVDYQVSMKVVFLLLAQAFVNLSGDSSVVLTPLEGLEPEFIEKYISLIPPAFRDKVLRFDSLDGLPRDGPSRGPVLTILDSNGLQAPTLKKFTDLARSSRGVTVVVSREGKGKTANLPGLVPGARAKVYYMGGTLLLASDAPFSQYVGISVVNRNGLPALELEPMV